MSTRTVNDSSSAPTDDASTDARRGPHAVVALAAFAALVAGAMGIVFLLVTLARAAQGAG